MDEPVLEISQRKYGTESQVITMRITRQMLAAIDEAAKISKRSRNEVLSMALEFSLDHAVISGQIPEEARTDVLYITEKERKTNRANKT